jgi:hypothetical protein
MASQLSRIGPKARLRETIANSAVCSRFKVIVLLIAVTGLPASRSSCTE